MRQRITLLAPFVLIPLAAIVFRQTAQYMGPAVGTLAGFLFYQLFGCILFPCAMLGGRNVLHLFRSQEPFFQRRNVTLVMMLALTVAGAIPLFLGYARVQTAAVFLIGIPLTVFNGVCEEMLWRGVFMRMFPKRYLLSVLYPALLFACWHLAPQCINPDLTLRQALPLVFMALPLGLVYGHVAHRTQSIRWVSIAHGISGILAFGIPLSTSLAAVIGIR